MSTTFLRSCLNPITFMFSGTAAGAVKPINFLALEVTSPDWLRAGDSHDVQGALELPAQKQDEYKAAADIRTLTECSRSEELEKEESMSLDTRSESIQGIKEHRQMCGPILAIATRARACAHPSQQQDKKKGRRHLQRYPLP
jgi:hypothetical protein